jgi:hypothetical protein
MKAARAKEHLDSLRAELQTYYDTKPCVIQENDDVANNLYRIRIKVTDPPERLSLIAGDVFGCLRASLDHPVWSLCTLNTGSYAEYTHFPIMEENKAPSFKAQIRGITRRRGHYRVPPALPRKRQGRDRSQSPVATK